jgi:hypothetical protein
LSFVVASNWLSLKTDDAIGFVLKVVTTRKKVYLETGA